jgi:hypothetical protein
MSEIIFTNRQTTRGNVTMHIKHIYDEDESTEERTNKDFLQVRTEGKRDVNRKV